MSTLAIKVYQSTDLGAPAMTGQLGKLVDLLDAVLVNGYGSVSVSSINRTSTTATVVTATAHGFITGDSALIGGAAESAYNIDAVVTVIDTTTFTYAVAGSPSTPATGTITSKRAPADFAKSFAGTNQAAYRSNNVAYTRPYLQVLDDGAGTAGNFEARMRGFETMSSVTVGTGPFPTVAQSAFGYIQKKSATLDATARPWCIISDGVTFYTWILHNQTTAVAFSTTSNQAFPCGFGDIVSYKSGDAYSGFLCGTGSESTTTSNTDGLCYQATGLTGPTTLATSPLCMPRDFTGTGTSKFNAWIGTGTQVAMSSSVVIPYPNPTDGAMYVVPIQVIQGTPNSIRGKCPGLYETLHGVNTHTGLDVLDNVTGLSGRKLKWLPGTQASTSSGHWVDITGPWR